ncbi:MAG: hypothetical protein ACR2P2_13040 [Nakamurella sp.]
MAAIKGRRRQPGAPDHLGKRLINGWVPDATHAKLNRVCDAVGISTALLLHTLIERLEVDESGLPAWLPPADADHQQELPLKTA